MSKFALYFALICTVAEAKVPHGFWDLQRIKQAIQLLATRGHTLDAKSIRAGKIGTSCAQILSEIHEGLTGLALYKGVQRQEDLDLPSRWDSALTISGYDPADHRLEIAWTAPLFAKLLNEVHKEQKNLSQSAFRSKSVDAIVRRLSKLHLKQEVGSRGMVAAGILLHGSWPLAVLAVAPEGFDPRTLFPQVSWTKEMTEIGIAALDAAGIDVHPYAISSDTSQNSTTVLEAALDVTTTAAALYDRGLFYHQGSWREALTDSKVDWRRVYRRTATLSWSRDLVLETVDELDALGYPLLYDLLSSKAPLPVSVALQKKLGGIPTGYALIGASRTHFVNWTGLVTARGIELSEQKRRFDQIFSVGQFWKFLALLESLGVSTAPRDLVRRDDQDFWTLSATVFGFQISGLVLMWIARHNELSQTLYDPVLEHYRPIAKGLPFPSDRILLELVKFDGGTVPMVAPVNMARTFQEQWQIPVDSADVEKAIRALVQHRP